MSARLEHLTEQLAKTDSWKRVCLFKFTVSLVVVTRNNKGNKGFHY